MVKNLQKGAPSVSFLALAALFFLIFGGPPRASAQNPATIRISALPFISYAPIYIAFEEGYFAEQGLNLEFVKFQEVGQSMPALARGDLDVSADSIGSSLFSAVSRGLKIKIVADKGHFAKGCSSSGIVVRKELYDKGELRNISQLRGRKVSLALIPIWGYVYETILSKGNLTLDDIEIVTLPVASRVTALKTGAIDAAGVTEPMLTAIKSLGIGVELASYHEYVPGYPASVIIFGPSLSEKNRELGQKFMVAYLKGIRQFNEGKTSRNLSILEKHMGLDQDTLKKICFISFHPDGHVDVDIVRAIQDWAYKRGHIDSKAPLNDLLDMSFVEYASGVLGKSE